MNSYFKMKMGKGSHVYIHNIYIINNEKIHRLNQQWKNTPLFKTSYKSMIVI